jgi:hypothetical protein
VQVDPADTVFPAQVSVPTLKLDAVPTVSVSAEMTRGAVPVFFKVTVWVALVDSAGVVKVSVDALSETAGATVAVPVTDTVAAPVLVLSAIVSVAELVPPAVGAKVTDTVQLPDTAIVVPQVVVSEYELELAPENDIAPSVTGTVPLLVSVTDCGVLVDPAAVSGNVSEEALRLIVGTATEPLNTTEADGVLELLAIVSVAE